MKILENFSNLFRLDTPGMISSIFSGYTKRKAEVKYDDMMDTDFGKHLKNLSPEKKHAIELAMYFFTGVLHQKFPDNTAVQQYVKEVLVDSSSEIAKRMMNGVEKDLENIPITNERRTLMNLLSDLEPGDLNNVVEKLYSMNANEREVILEEFQYLNPEKLKKVATMDPDDFKKFSEILKPKKGFWEKERESLEQALRNYVNSGKENPK